MHSQLACVFALLIGAFLLEGQVVAQSAPTTNYENSGVVSEMIGSNAAGSLAYSNQFTAQFADEEAKSCVNDEMRRLRGQASNASTIASRRPLAGRPNADLSRVFHVFGQGSAQSESWISDLAMRSELDAKSLQLLGASLKRLVSADQVDAKELVRAVKAYNRVLEGTSATFWENPPKKMASIRMVLASLVASAQRDCVSEGRASPFSAGRYKFNQGPIPLPKEENGIKIKKPLAVPGTTIATPTAFGARWGQVYVSGSYQPLSRYYTIAESDWKRGIWADGTISLGGGLGNPYRWVGIDLTLNLLDTFGMWSTDEFANERSISVKVHRVLLSSASVAIGYENVWQNSSVEGEGGSSFYAVASKTVNFPDRVGRFFSQLSVTAGLGNDRFLSESSFQRRERGVNVFGSIAVRVMPFLAAITEWTGQDMNVGLSIRPHSRLPIVVTPALVDLTGRAGDRPRFSVGVAMTYDFQR